VHGWEQAGLQPRQHKQQTCRSNENAFPGLSDVCYGSGIKGRCMPLGDAVMQPCHALVRLQINGQNGATGLYRQLHAVVNAALVMKNLLLLLAAGAAGVITL